MYEASSSRDIEAIVTAGLTDRNAAVPLDTPVFLGFWLTLFWSPHPLTEPSHLLPHLPQSLLQRLRPPLPARSLLLRLGCTAMSRDWLLGWVLDTPLIRPLSKTPRSHPKVLPRMRVAAENQNLVSGCRVVEHALHLRQALLVGMHERVVKDE